MKLFCLGLIAASVALAQQYTISNVAGSAVLPTPAIAVDASIGNTNSVARDTAGNIFFSSGASVFRVDTAGTLWLVAGNGTVGYSGDGGPATQAQLSNPWGVAVDQSGNVYIADELNNRIRRVSPAGVITTVAGIGSAGFSGDGGSAVDAELHFPLNVAVDVKGNLYIADLFNNRIRRVSPNGIIVTIAGGGATNPGDGGLATNAVIAGPAGMAVDSVGNIFVADRGGNRVRKIATNGIITTVAGTGISGFSGDDGLATSAQMYLPSDVAVDAGGNLYIADFNNNVIRKVSSAGIISSIGSGLQGPSGVVLDGTGSIYVADRFNNRIEKLSSGGIPTLIAGNGTTRSSGDGGPAASALLANGAGVALDQSGNVYIADSLNGRIRKVSTNGVITTVAGGGIGGDGVLATGAYLSNPQGVCFDSQGNLYIAESGAQKIRKVSTSGIITTVAGTGTQGNTGDGGLALSASLFNPTSVVADTAGNIYILVQGRTSPLFLSGNAIRKVASDGTITTVVAAVTLGPGITAAQSYNPTGIAVDSTGDLFVAEVTLLPLSVSGPPSYGQQILKILPDGTSTVLAQTSGAIGVDAAGNVIVVGGGTVQKITPGGVTSTYPINGSVGANGIAVDPAGKIYVVQQYSVVVLQQAAGLPATSTVVVSAVVDAASESAVPVSPGKIVAIYGTGLGPVVGVSNQASNSVFSTSVSGTSVTFNGFPAPILYTSSTEIVAIVPYAVGGQTAQVVATYQAQLSQPLTVPAAPVAPSIFTRNQTGAGQAAAINVADGTLNTAANPAKPGSYVSLYATGEGQTTPLGADGRLGGAQATHPNANVTASVGGIAASVQYAGGVFGVVSGLMQVNVLIPAGIAPGGYVPVVVQVGGIASNAGTWIAVGN